MVEIEKRIQRLKDALAAGKITQELYDANMAKIQKEIDAMKAAAAPEPAQTTDKPAAPARTAGKTAEPASNATESKPKPKKEKADEDILADLLKREPPKSEDLEDLDLEAPAEIDSEAEELEMFLESISTTDDDDEPVPAPAAAKPADGEDDDLLLDDLYDSLVLHEVKVPCPLCGTELPEGTTTCTNCAAQLTEDGQLKEEVAIETLADSIEDGLAELEGLAEEIIEEEVGGEPEIEPPKVAAPTVTEPDVDIYEEDIPDKLDITEEQLPKIHTMGIRMIDIVVFGTVGALVAVFALFGLWNMGNMTAVSAGTFFGIAIAGMLVTFMLFRISTSAIAEGDRQFKAGKYELALAHYDRAIRFSNKPASAWTSKGVAQKRLGDYGSALRSHNAAIKLDPKNEIAWCNKGDLLYRMGRLDLALDCYDNAIDFNKRYAIAWNNKGTTLAKLGRFKEAKLCQDIATKLKPRYAAAWVNKGEILARMGQRQEAIVCYRKAKKLVGA